MRVAVTGATGFVGRRLLPLLVEAGHVPLALTREAGAARRVLGEGVEVHGGDPRAAGDVAEALRGADAVVNLQGENLFGRRWSDAVRADLRASRVDSTTALVEALGALGAEAPRTLVSASAIGIYGPQAPDVRLAEDAPPGSDFLARLCVDWEEAALAARAQGTRVVLLRIGPVLGPGGGALAAMEGPFRKFVGGPVGSGKQTMSWIHRLDLCRLILFALEHEALQGPVNATAPNPVSNKVFSKALGRALHRPSWAPAPAFMLKLALGGVATVVTEGQDVRPARALAAGFSFRYPTVDEALAAVYASAAPSA